LLQTKVLFEGLFESAPDAIVVADSEGSIVQINKQAGKMFGYKKEEVSGKPIEIFVPQRLREKHVEHRNGYISKPHVRPMGIGLELYGMRKDGSEFPVDIALGPFETAKGIVTLAVIRDITESKLLVEALRESEMRYRMLFEGAEDAIFILEAQGENAGRIIAANNAAAEMHGYTVNELVTMKIFDLDTPDAAKEAPGRIRRILRGEFVKAEITHRKKDGTVFPVEISAGLLELRKHKYVLAFDRDITGRRQIDEKLAQTIAELERSNKELEQFAYIASHDLQEPLRMVTSFTQLLEKRYKGKLDKDADEFIGFVVDGTTRMQRMIDDLLGYSRVGTRGKPFQPTDCEIVFNEAIANLKVVIEGSGAAITHDHLPTITADGSQMVQLFQNLLSNAIKFRKEAPRVHVSSELKGNKYVFSVRDNGIGIAQEYFDRLFKLFQRLHSIEEYPGTGIGLAVSKKIVERHGGQIWVESEPGTGSTFFFTLPVNK
jgi:PAS domain S-box-containing protein